MRSRRKRDAVVALAVALSVAATVARANRDLWTHLVEVGPGHSTFEVVLPTEITGTPDTADRCTVENVSATGAGNEVGISFRFVGNRVSQSEQSLLPAVDGMPPYAINTADFRLPPIMGVIINTDSCDLGCGRTVTVAIACGVRD